MAKEVDDKSRRNFLKTGVSTAGVLGLAASAGCSQQTGTQIVDINAVFATPEQWEDFLALPDRPVVMLNLLKFKPDRGAEEFGKYGAAVGPLIKNIGAKVSFLGEAATCLIGNGNWDMIALVEYPSPAALYQLVNSDEYQAIHHHREAGLEGQVLYAVLQYQDV